MSDLPTNLDKPFGSLPDLLKAAAHLGPDKTALVLDDETLSYRVFDAWVDGVAGSLHRDGLQPGDVVAICAQTSLRYVALYYGTLRAGGVVAPLPPSASAKNLTGMLENSEARWLFIDKPVDDHWAAQRDLWALQRIAIDDSDIAPTWTNWMDTAALAPTIEPGPDWPFNLIYSSGTTGVPKGIVQPWGMRWSHAQLAWRNGYRPDSVLLTGTPLYSNTTLVALLPALAIGATVVMMAKFDALNYLRLAQRHRASHTILVPIQYQRLLDHPEFDRHDLSSFKAKFSTSAPFSASLKVAVLERWPGALTEIYGMTEGGGRCELLAHLHRDKLHTVGQPAAGHDIRIIDEEGIELPDGELGEIVGRSASMMKGYHRQPDKTREAEWFSPDGQRFIRTGDVGRFDADGFLILGDRKKDMLISGGFNIYPSDLEAELKQHTAVVDCAVVGAASRQWGETPVGFVVLRPDSAVNLETLRDWVNARLGKTQRIARLLSVDELPRNLIGKVLKRELRDAFTKQHGVLD